MRKQEHSRVSSPHSGNMLIVLSVS